MVNPEREVRNRIATIECRLSVPLNVYIQSNPGITKCRCEYSCQFVLRQKVVYFVNFCLYRHLRSTWNITSPKCYPSFYVKKLFTLLTFHVKCHITNKLSIRFALKSVYFVNI